MLILQVLKSEDYFSRIAQPIQPRYIDVIDGRTTTFCTVITKAIHC